MGMHDVTMAQKRLRGRPRLFDEDEALDRAMALFWSQGYEATSLDDLVARTGIPRPTLYNVYGDKQALFALCLQRYAAKRSGGILAAARNATTIRDAVLMYLRETIINATEEEAPLGCMIVSVASLGPGETSIALARQVFAQAAKTLEDLLARAVRAGDLPKDFPCATRARQIVDHSNALAVRARVGVSRRMLLHDADADTEFLLSYASRS